MSHESSDHAQIEEDDGNDGAASDPFVKVSNLNEAALNPAKALERQERRRKKLVEEEAQRDRYNEQRNMWLAKEGMFDKISTAKQKAKEIEAEAARTMKASVDEAVSSIALPPRRPMYTAAKKETSYKAPQIPNMPNFVRSEDNITHQSMP
ncbi:hypothetical protein NQZ79_g217 [Umbelopsis isabellina]|nr:hypothetical protein NQZ79_g217 [Umbelopsis isabellina]